MSGFDPSSLGQPASLSNGSVYDRHGTEIGYVDPYTNTVRDSTYGRELGSASQLTPPGSNPSCTNLTDYQPAQDMFSQPNPLNSGYNPYDTGYNPYDTGYNPYDTGYNPLMNDSSGW